MAHLEDTYLVCPAVRPQPVGGIPGASQGALLEIAASFLGLGGPPLPWAGAARHRGRGIGCGSITLGPCVVCLPGSYGRLCGVLVVRVGGIVAWVRAHRRLPP